MKRKIVPAMILTTLTVGLVAATGTAATPPPQQDSGCDCKVPELFVPNGQDKKQYEVDMNQLNSIAHLPNYQDTKIYKGVNQGAGYWIEVPANWNGKLVLYAHGYRGTGKWLTVSEPKIREHLIQEGYAWAASSYSTNGYDVQTGVKDTHALNAVFRQVVGNSARTYITGHSMGGHVTGVYAEQYGDVDGALPMCGVLGDSELFDFFADASLTAQAIDGIDKAQQVFPADTNYFTNTVPKLENDLGGGAVNVGGGWRMFKGLTDKGQTWKNAVMNLSGGQRPMFDQGFGFFNDFLLNRIADNPTYGQATGNVVNNTDSVYQLDNDPALSAEETALNNSVLRITNDPQARHANGLAAIPKVTGNLRVPTISVHTLGDLYVPFSMEEIYAQRAASYGKSDLLKTRAIRAVQHCDSSALEESEAFDALVNWAENGVTAEGDSLDPADVAKPDYGTKFTHYSAQSKLHPGDPLLKP